jgi:hypothetical protein
VLGVLKDSFMYTIFAYAEICIDVSPIYEPPPGWVVNKWRSAKDLQTACENTAELIRVERRVES